MRKLLIVTASILVLASGSAIAADMPLKVPPAQAPADIWTGGYVGANMGYEWGRDPFSSNSTPGNCTTTAAAPGCFGPPIPNYYSMISALAATFNSSVNHKGPIFGGQAGYNWLVHNMIATWTGVLGVELDFQGLSDSRGITLTSVTPTPAFPGFPLNQTVTQNEKITTLGTLRGRAGVLSGPNTLIYATAGLAWASASSSANYLQGIFAGGGGGSGPYAASGSVSREMFGPVVGGGVEWKWTANWSVKAEYLYADLGHLGFNTAPLQNPYFGAGGGLVSVANVSASTHVRENIARVGINYKL